MDSFSKFTQNVSSNWSPFAEKVGKSFTQYKQLASEKLTNGGETTDLPQDYLALEQRFEAIRQTTQTMSKLAKSYTAEPVHYDMQALQQQFTALTSKIASKPSGPHQQQQQQAEPSATMPNTYQHEMARAALDVSERVGLEEPLGAALFKFGSIEDKVGAEKLKQDKAIQEGFVQPMLTGSLDTGIQVAQTARKQVVAARLTLDAAKTSFRAATRPEKAEQARREAEQAEDHFVTVIEEAMRLMRAVVESPETLRLLTAFVKAQLAFHREAAALLGDLAPELEEIQVTQEALYRYGNNNNSA
ncbi:BAR domain-containing protein [Coemansia sp. Benny D115]|nr:BAR domain-containing protein [Coemansia sp. Benny D115]